MFWKLFVSTAQYNSGRHGCWVTLGNGNLQNLPVDRVTQATLQRASVPRCSSKSLTASVSSEPRRRARNTGQSLSDHHWRPGGVGPALIDIDVQIRLCDITVDPSAAIVDCSARDMLIVLPETCRSLPLGRGRDEETHISSENSRSR